MLKINIGSNFLGAGYQIVLQIVLLPIVFNALGPEAYGLVGLFTILTNVFSLLDLGMSPALGRELSRLSAIENSGARMRRTITTLEIVCGGLALVIGTVLFSSSEFVGRYWIKDTTLPLPIVSSCLSWMALQIAFQFMMSFYSSGLTGLQKIVRLNILQSTLQTIRAAAVVALLYAAPKWLDLTLIEQFFILNAMISGVGLILIAISLYGALPENGDTAMQAGSFWNVMNRFHVECFQTCWRYAAGMTATMAVVMLLTQLDKIVLSKVLSLEQFGFYSIASGIAITMAKPAPLVFSAVLPRFTQLVAVHDTAALGKTYLQSVRLTAWIVLPVAGMVIFFSGPLFDLYLNHNTHAGVIAALASVLIMGYSLHSLTYMPYALSLAYGWTRYGFNISLVACIFLLPIILFCALQFGAIGAAYGWLILNIGYLIFSIRYLHKHILPELYAEFYVANLIPGCLFILMIFAYFMS